MNTSVFLVEMRIYDEHLEVPNFLTWQIINRGTHVNPLLDIKQLGSSSDLINHVVFA